ncbi:MAG TPA: outer membrane protein transport protein [Polyangiales bacterium]|nr:outer membrane protein transport protein [Polyangiales bacterium]
MRPHIFLLYVASLLAAVTTLVPSTALAGGLFLFDRGARPLSRGGAFVAGVDDPNALWYNPAGMAESGDQIMGDAVLTVPFASVTRTNPDGTPMAKVDASPLLLPIPQLGITHRFGLKNVTFGAGIFAPNVMIIGYPRSLRQNGMNVPAPTRYSLINLEGSILSTVALGAAYHGIKGLSLGAALHITGGRFTGSTALNACDGTLCTFPEDQAFDAYVTFDALPVYGFSGVFGAILNAGDRIRFGASVTLPYTLRGSGTMKTRLPNSVLFEDATVAGNKLDFSMKMPTILRIGSEIRPVRALRMEGAVVWEQWSRQKSIDITPKNVEIQNIAGIDNYQIGKVALQRNMRNVLSVRGGFEAFLPASLVGRLLKKLRFAMRGGLAWEKGAFDSKAMSPLTLDANKVLITGGLSVDLAKWLRFDTSAGYIWMQDSKIRDSQITQPAALRPGYIDASVIGNGDYKMEAFFLGGGFAIRLH